MRIKNIIYNEDAGKLLLRVSISLLMLMHGVHKIKIGILDIQQWLVSLGVPSFFSYGVYIPEILAPIFLICGVFVRSVSVILIANMCVAILYLYTSGYAPFGIDPYGGFNAEVDVLYLLIFAVLLFLGGGKYSLGRK